MTRRPDYTDPYMAAYVTRFMDPAERGGWKIERFRITDEEEVLEKLRALTKGKQHGDVWGERWVPAGLYTKLSRPMTDDEQERHLGRRVNNGDPRVPVMSDTPNEIHDHSAVIDIAYGRVLVHGLGLGCIVSALMAKPQVTHIDVVEANADVIALTGHYYEGPKVTIHHGSCVDYDWPQGTSWNVIWHDIWTEIAPRNLSDDSTAEHGISYARLHRKFARRCDVQLSWAFETARRMRAVEAREAREAERWLEKFRAADERGRLQMILRQTAEHPIGDGHFPLDKYEAFLRAHGPDIIAGYEKIATNAEKLTVGDALHIMGKAG